MGDLTHTLITFFLRAFPAARDQKMWFIYPKNEDFILSDRLEKQTITENGVHYGVEVFGKIFDNLSRQGLYPDDWIQDFTSLSNEFKIEVIEEF
ncbi:papain fold toxin domain-containing protein [Dolichospermum planctonicum]|uniref:Tox-PL-2 domain-containing protein n=1 Tax=Dolichospermum planctonicum TaxID=136072 RepID=A0A480AP90_9CYAN|nr:papain fold toxin domain-containing protein [Dolichospermum planctonicum]GCL43924.1 hypothetical protein NIES80_36440 [Dolichospermum planctonicum]